MIKQLILDDITDRVRKEVATISTTFISLGRNPGDEGLTLDSVSISSLHGHLVRYKDSWFYVDAGSTNGSWVNGKKVRPGQYNVVRPGTVLQLADRAFQLSQQNAEGKKIQKFLDPALLDEYAHGRSICVFLNNEFVDEFPAANFSRAVAVGGEEAEISLPELKGQRPIFMIEDRNESLYVYTPVKVDAFSVNGELVEENATLTDNDEIRFREYLFVVNEPMKGTEPDMVESGEDAAEILDQVGIRGWGDNEESPVVDVASFGSAAQTEAPGAVPTFQAASRSRAQAHGVFGSVDDTQEMNQIHAGYSSHRSSSFPKEEPRPDNFFQQLEQKVTLIIGLLLLVVIMGLVAWWLIKLAS